VPLDERRRAILQRLRSMPPGTRSPAENRLMEDLLHQQGVSSVEDAIAAGGDEKTLDDREGPREIPRCPSCKSVNVSGRSTPTEMIWRCLEKECGREWRAACGPTLHGAVRPLPAAPPIVPVGDTYYPSGGGSFRHPLMNYDPEDL
jgi:hypothetical protein